MWCHLDDGSALGSLSGNIRVDSVVRELLDIAVTDLEDAAVVAQDVKVFDTTPVIDQSGTFTLFTSP